MGHELVEGIRLSHSGEHVEAVSALADHLGGRVGLDAVLGDLNRVAQVTDVPGRAARWGFRWNEEDLRSERWFPQGISTSADQSDTDDVGGRLVVCVSWYSKTIRWHNLGSRLTFVDLTDRDRPRYRHVLLVEPNLHRGRLSLKPVHVHAGGIVWHGPYLYVAGTRRGIRVFRLDDLVEAPTDGNHNRLRIRRGDVDAFGYKYLLPVRFSYDAETGKGTEQMRYSFLSLDRSTSPHQLIGGEYGKNGMSTRLARFEIDPSTSLLLAGEDGYSVPVQLHPGGVEHMQGATVVHGTYYVTTSAGTDGLGDLWVGRPGELRRHPNVLPIGPEDITYWPSTGQLWSLTEYPARRYVYAMDRSDFD